MNRLESERRRLCLQSELDAARTRRERNAMGQFATPAPLAIDILQSAHELMEGRNAGVRFMDPAFGTGSFFSALLQVFSPDSIAAAYGYEIDPHYGAPASRLWAPHGLHLELADFTRSRPGRNGIGPVDLIVCNPPYVRHHHIEGFAKARHGAVVRSQLGIRVSGLAGLYVYFLLLSHQWLCPNALSIWLIPSEFMDVNYGAALKRYLLERVDLVRIHRFDPEESQFDDALVSSCVVWFRNRRAASFSRPEFTLGGTLHRPRRTRRIRRDELVEECKWTRFPDAQAAHGRPRTTLRDFFRIKRGIATGANRFFIMDEQRIREHSIPSRFLRPVLPSPRYVADDVISSNPDGTPRIERPLFLLNCRVPLEVLERTEPRLADYIRQGEADGLNQRYLASRRFPWYGIETRDPAPFLCTYMGRSTDGGPPFRIIFNRSSAIVTNVYLMLYPRAALQRRMDGGQGPMATFAALRNILDSEWETSRRVYGGGLYKVEPRELGRLAADALVDALPELRAVGSGQARLALRTARD